MHFIKGGYISPYRSTCINIKFSHTGHSSCAYTSSRENIVEHYTPFFESISCFCCVFMFYDFIRYFYDSLYNISFAPLRFFFLPYPKTWVHYSVFRTDTILYFRPWLLVIHCVERINDYGFNKICRKSHVLCYVICNPDRLKIFH